MGIDIDAMVNAELSGEGARHCSLRSELRGDATSVREQERCGGAAMAAAARRGGARGVRTAVPVLIRWQLSGVARAEQVDRAHVADARALLPSLDAIVSRVVGAVLGLVGDAQPVRARARCMRSRE